MKYILAVPGKHHEIEIEKDRFSILKSSRKILTNALAVEEKYEILISNYLDLEKESINASVSDMIRGKIEYADFFDIRLALNMRLVNLLTSVRLYTDQLASHLFYCLPHGTDIKKRTKKFFSTEYNKNSDFRFMEALRNHVQHSDTPVHRISFDSKRTDLNDSLLEYSLYFSTQKEHLLADGDFKKQVLSEMPDEVNLLSATRSYIESVSVVHSQARELIRKSVAEARASIEEAIADYKSVCKDHFVDLHAYAFDGDEKNDELAVFLDWDNVRLRLEKRNKQLLNLTRRYVTGQAHNK